MTESPYIHEATQESFQRLAVERSAAVPVLVDFWAAWCAPCRSLMPVLARLAGEFGGRFELVKVNTDQERELAGAYGIRSLPTVVLLRHGKVVDQFMGAQPESAIRALLERHLPRPSDPVLDRAEALREAGDPAAALALVEGVLANDAQDLLAKLARARLLLDLGRLEEFETAVAALPSGTQHDTGIGVLRARAEFARRLAGAGSAATLEQRLTSQPDDLDARIQLAAHQVAAGEHAAALDNLLDVVRRDRRHDDEAGRRLVLALFRILGQDHSLVRQGRSRLATLLN